MTSVSDFSYGLINIKLDNRKWPGICYGSLVYRIEFSDRILVTFCVIVIGKFRKE